MESGGGTRTKGCDVIGVRCNATFLQGSSSLSLSGYLHFSSLLPVMVPVPTRELF